MDSIFMFVCVLLVMLMTPALALFYGGIVTKKNVLSTTMHSYASMGIVSLQWILVGYSLSFGSDWFGIIGKGDWTGLQDVGFSPNVEYSETIPHGLFMMFQMMFAILTPAILSGSLAERMKFSSFLLFILAWTTIVYDPLAHWVWGVGGWIRELGALDFAGGTVVHISSGVAGLVVCLLLGKRKFKDTAKPHHLPFAVFGAGLLWFGWFGFNVGSSLSWNEVALNALITTNTGASMGALSWMVTEWILKKKPTVFGMACGAVSGLVAITPACGFVTPLSSIWIGLISGVICYFSISYVKEKMKYDDALDAFGIHGVGGIWGAIATGLFATTSINPSGSDGLFYGGGTTLLWKQFIAVGSTILFVAVMTYLIIKIIHVFLPIRVDEKSEEKGLDTSIHGESAYS